MTTKKPNTGLKRNNEMIKELTPSMSPDGWCLSLCLLVSVKEVRSPGSESESSDVEARSTGDVTPPSTPGTTRTEKKAIGRSSSVTSSGPFVATPEWVSARILFFFTLSQ